MNINCTSGSMGERVTFTFGSCVAGVVPTADSTLPVDIQRRRRRFVPFFNCYGLTNYSNGTTVGSSNERISRNDDEYNWSFAYRRSSRPLKLFWEGSRRVFIIIRPRTRNKYRESNKMKRRKERALMKAQRGEKEGAHHSGASSSW